MFLYYPNNKLAYTVVLTWAN